MLHHTLFQIDFQKFVDIFDIKYDQDKHLSVLHMSGMFHFII